MVGFIQSFGALKSKSWIFLKEKFYLKTEASTSASGSRLSALPVLRLAGPQVMWPPDHVSQFPDFLNSLCLSSSVSLSVSVSLSYWFCFFGDPWLIRYLVKTQETEAWEFLELSCSASFSSLESALKFTVASASMKSSLWPHS